jgi:hypothetical protein
MNALYLDSHPTIPAYFLVSFFSFGALIASYFYNLVAIAFIPIIIYVIVRFRAPEEGDILGNGPPLKTYKPFLEFTLIIVIICSGVVLLDLAPIVVSQIIWCIFTFCFVPLSIYFSKLIH